MVAMATLSGLGTTSPRLNPRATGSTVSGGLNIESGLRAATDKTTAYLQEAKDLYEPYLSGGTKSLDEYLKLLLGGVDSLQENDANFNAMTDYAERKVMANKAVGGLLRSTGTAGALNDSLLEFQNNYYGNRLNQLMGGVELGKYGTDNTASIYGNLGDNQRGLAEALAQIQIEREGMASNEKAAANIAGATKDAAKNSGGLFGHGGFLGLGI